MTETMTGFVPQRREPPDAQRVKRSMFTVLVDDTDADCLLYNTLTGNFLKVPAGTVSFLRDEHAVLDTAGLNPFQRMLFDQGFLVPADADEIRRSRILHDSRMRMGSRKRMELILLPHENCNFRCSYCYEIFARNKMEPWVREATKTFVLRQLAELRQLDVNWFGGEPTLALDVVHSLSEAFISMCGQVEAGFAAQMTTNGFKLVPEVATRLIRECGLRQFQITLDGDADEHDQRRHLVGGGRTFERIYENLLGLRDLPDDFSVILRVNFDEMNGRRMAGFTDRLAADFGGDRRFVIHFFPISRWGGAGDGALPVCDATIGRALKYQLLERAVDRGFGSRIGDEIQPMGTACYAADPNSLIIGADGTLYKCTVAFEDERNKVGKLLPDGTTDIDIDRYGLWVVNDGVTDHNCQTCFFNPSCQGVSCPLWRMESGQSPCPTVKEEFPTALRILAKELSDRGPAGPARPA